jgi:uncharacterized membrane protein YhaH (DUF805 family)
MGKLGTLKELFEFMKKRKKYWLAPIVILLILMIFLIIFTETISADINIQVTKAKK